MQVGRQWVSTLKYCADDTDREVTQLISRAAKIVEESDGLSLYDEDGQKILVAGNVY